MRAIHESYDMALAVTVESTIKHSEVLAPICIDSTILNKRTVSVIPIIDNAIVVKPSNGLSVAPVDWLHCDHTPLMCNA